MAEGHWTDILSKVSLVAQIGTMIPGVNVVACPLAIGTSIILGGVSVVDRYQRGESVASTIAGIGADLLLSKVAASQKAIGTTYKLYKAVSSTKTVTCKLSEIYKKGLDNTTAWEFIDVFNQVISTSQDWKTLKSDVCAHAKVLFDKNTVTLKYSCDKATKTMKFTIKTKDKTRFQNFKNTPRNTVVEANCNVVFEVTYDESLKEDIFIKEEI